MNKWFNQKWFYRLIALIFTLLLFIYVNIETGPNQQNNGIYNNSMLVNKQAIINVPLQINANNQKYYITGYPKTVKVKLEGPSSLVTQTINTQRFQIIANLRGLSIGKHNITLTEKGLNNALTYTIIPKSITVNIQLRKTINFPIQVSYNKSSIANGYEAQKPYLSQNYVEVSGAKDEIRSISAVIANIPLERNSKNTVSVDVPLQAINSYGNTVNAIIFPSNVRITLPIYSSKKSKTVELNPIAINSDNKKFSLICYPSKVKAFGSENELSKLNKLNLNVNVQGINSNSEQTINIPTKNNVNFDPNKVTVIINKVNDSEDSETSSKIISNNGYSDSYSYNTNNK